MRKLILLPIIAILTLAIGVNSVLLVQQTGKLGEINSGIAAVEGNIATLRGSVANLQGNVSSLQSSFTGVQSNVGNLQTNVASLQGTISGLQNNLNNLQGNVAGLQGNIASVLGNVSSLQAKLTSAEAKISALQADIAKFQATANTQQILSPSDLVVLVEPVVVKVETSRGSGSGIIVSRTGYVLTAEHVVSNVTSVTISLANGTRYTASSIISRDARRDLAVIKINSSRTDFPEAVLGSSVNTSVGEPVMAVGYSLGFAGRPSFSQGIVSAFRIEDGLNYLQTDASINPGNSGGPLFNFKGQVIGINVAKYVNVNVDNVGLAIPIDETRTIIQNTVK